MNTTRIEMLAVDFKGSNYFDVLDRKKKTCPLSRALNRTFGIDHAQGRVSNAVMFGNVYRLENEYGVKQYRQDMSQVNDQTPDNKIIRVTAIETP